MSQGLCEAYQFPAICPHPAPALRTPEREKGQRTKGWLEMEVKQKREVHPHVVSPAVSNSALPGYVSPAVAQSLMLRCVLGEDDTVLGRDCRDLVHPTPALLCLPSSQGAELGGHMGQTDLVSFPRTPMGSSP